MLLLLNASPGEVSFTLPAVAGSGLWTTLVDTARHELAAVDGGAFALAPNSLALLRFGRERRVTHSGGAAAVNAAAVSTAGAATPTVAVPEEAGVG
jgi:hypothetical protein